MIAIEIDKERDRMTERENALKVFRGELPEWIPCYTKATTYLFSDYTNAEKPQNYEGYDWFGVHWLPVSATANLTHPDIHQEPIFDDISEWRDHLKLPDVDSLDWETIGRQLNEQCDAAGDGTIFTIMLEHGMFERLTLLMGFENALIALYDDPEACQDYCEAMADFKISVIDHLVAACPRIEMLDWHDDLGSQNAALMSPDKWVEIFSAATARVAQHVRDIGRLFMYHSCGRIDQIMDKVLEYVKPDGWNVLQSCNDQPFIKKNFGRKVVLVSGLDTQNYVDIPNPTVEDLNREVQRTIDIFAPGGGFMAGMYLPGCFSDSGLDVNGIIEEAVTRIGRDYYQDKTHCVFP